MLIQNTVKHKKIVTLVLLSTLLPGHPSLCSAVDGLEGHELPDYKTEQLIYICTDMEQDIAVLDVLDRDMLFLRAKHYSLPELKRMKTMTSPPRKYSDLTTPARLKRFKEAVDSFYKNGQKKPVNHSGDCLLHP